MRNVKIINSVLLDHGICREDLLGRSRLTQLVEARKDAACRLSDAGYSRGMIARFLKRDHHTIVYYLDGRVQQMKNEKDRNRSPLYWLEPHVRQAVQEAAACEGVPVRDIIARWVADRAGWESAQKVRAA